MIYITKLQLHAFITFGMNRYFVVFLLFEITDLISSDKVIVRSQQRIVSKHAKSAYDLVDFLFSPVVFSLYGRQWNEFFPKAKFK